MQIKLTQSSNTHTHSGVHVCSIYLPSIYCQSTGKIDTNGRLVVEPILISGTH
jgi:hypothetical protein